MLRISIALLLTAVFVSAGFAQQQGFQDIQSLQYEFGRGVSPAPVPPPPRIVQPSPQPWVVAPKPCAKPVVITQIPLRSSVIYTPVYTACRPHCTARCCVTPKTHWRVVVQPAYSLPYYRW